MMGPRTECGSGGNSTLTESQCQKLRAADAYVWTVASVLLFSAICFSWLYAYCMRMVGKNHLARWCEDTARLYFLGIIWPFCLGVLSFAVGLGVRGVLITADSTLPAGAPFFHAGVWGASWLSIWVYWLALSCRTTGMRSVGQVLAMRKSSGACSFALALKTSQTDCTALMFTEFGGWGLRGLGQDKKLQFGADPVPYLDTHCDPKRSL